MRKKVITIAIVVLVITILVIIVVNNLYKKEGKLQNIDIFSEDNVKKIEEKKENIKDGETLLKVGPNNIEKYDIEIEQRRITQMSNEQKLALAKSENAIIETTKKFVEKEEALKSGIKISEEKQNTFKEISEKMYENTDKTISKDKYIEKWVEIQEREELADLYRAKIIKKITLKELECSNQEVNKAIDTFFENPTSQSLSEAYNEYLMYLISQYKLEF